MDIHDGNTIEIFIDILDDQTLSTLKAKMGDLSGVKALYFYYGMGYGATNMSTEYMGTIPPLNCPGIRVDMGSADPPTTPPLQPATNLSVGFNLDHAHNLAVSKDLVNWVWFGDVYPPTQTNPPDGLPTPGSLERPVGVYFRVKVVHNPRTKKYVMWTNYLPTYPSQTPYAQPPFTKNDKLIKNNKPFENPMDAYPYATYVVATSTSPLGPFAFHDVDNSTIMGGGGDMDIFVDQVTEVGYIAYDAWENHSPAGVHQVRVEQLTEDFLSSLGRQGPQYYSNNLTGPYGALSQKSHEAPALFGPYKGWYYLTFGHTCCFCQMGSQAIMLAASHPLGPWRDTGVDINPGGINQTPSLTNEPTRVRSQNSFVVTVNNVVDAPKFIFVGDPWESSPDRLKGHDLQEWEIIQFTPNATNASSFPIPVQLNNVANFTLEFL